MTHHPSTANIVGMTKDKLDPTELFPAVPITDGWLPAVSLRAWAEDHGELLDHDEVDDA